MLGTVVLELSLGTKVAWSKKAKVLPSILGRARGKAPGEVVEMHTTRGRQNRGGCGPARVHSVADIRTVLATALTGSVVAVRIQLDKSKRQSIAAGT